MLDAIRQSTSQDPPRTQSSPDQVASLLTTSRRIDVIEILAREREPTTLNDLADTITRRETGRIDTDVRKSVYITCYQSHLDQLAEHDVVEWDKDRGRIAPGPELDAYHAAVQELTRICRGDRHA